MSELVLNMVDIPIQPKSIKSNTVKGCFNKLNSILFLKICIDTNRAKAAVNNSDGNDILIPVCGRIKPVDMGMADMAMNKSHFFLNKKNKLKTVSVPNISKTKVTLLSGKIKNVVSTITPMRRTIMTV